ncbi:ribosome biogenesis factor YjgA [Halothiobacillus sp. DCM-1]|uniref:ribosome biogenesis factor YjgA n=1 Tax=Halothiobacillus sp. DCM-1 TaxID=3112558 RepID=UPI0032477BCD
MTTRFARRQSAPDSPPDGAEPSKSERKREAEAARDLGERLLALPESALGEFPLSDNLRAALREARRITAHGARRRQLQYIGKLMRQQDLPAIEAALSRIDPDDPHNVRVQHEAERWRNRLLNDPAALTAFIEAYPSVDAQVLRQVLRQVQKEQAEQKPPRDFRVLFRVLRTAIAAEEQPRLDELTE